MSEEQNIPEEETTDNSSQSTEENVQPVTDTQLQTEMEVHKHPHHVTHKKKWTEYLLEFFMLFFAVFLGFVAENWREHIVERNREKQYMESLVKDLALDTLELSKGNKFRMQKIGALDSTINILAAHNNPLVSLMVYNLTNKFYGSRSFFQNSGTLDQLKNSGGLRLINNRKIVDSIEAYDQQVRRMAKRDDYEGEAFVYNSRLGQKLFDARSVIKTLQSSNNIKAIPDSAISVKLNLAYLDEYLNNLMNYEFLIKNILGYLKLTKRQPLILSN